MVPPGRVYVYPEGSLVADTPEQLVSKLSEYRMENNLPQGDPARDVERELKKQDPSGRYFIATTPEPPKRSILDRVVSFIGGVYAKPPEQLVPETEANRREAICAACSQNKPIGGPCAPCITKVEQDAFKITQGRQPSFGSLGGCDITGQHNRIACQLPPNLLNRRTRFLDELKEKAPQCWLIDLKNE